jgi:RHS repeat-associated protein
MLLHVLAIALFATAEASHFRGGLIYWRTVGPMNPTTGIPVQITQRYGWRRDFSADTMCDEDKIRSQILTGETGDLWCMTGCQGSLGSVQVYCTDFNLIDDWMVGERTFSVILPNASLIEATFASCCWIYLPYGGDSWQVTTRFNFGAIFARRSGNSSPKTKMSPIINLLYGCNHTITIPVVDDDGDNVRCRWAAYNSNECGGVCHAFLGAVLDERKCTIQYNAVDSIGMFAVAIQIEDFYDRLETIPFSSVPLQFLVNVYQPSSINDTCYSKPTFVWPTRRNGACVAIPLNNTFSENFIAQSGGAGITIQDISTQSPIGVEKSPLISGETNTWYVTVTWNPLPSQSGSNIFCFSATDSTGATSAQSCITFAVGVYPPVVVNGSQYPTDKVYPNNSYWRLEFDRPFSRPIQSSFIRFHDDSGDEVLVVDTATSNKVQFPSSSAGRTLTFSTQFMFIEKATYFLTLDNGIVSGIDQCGPESVGIMFDSNFWRIYIRDITPPVLTFIQRPLYCNGDVSFTWIYDEPVRSTCVIQGSNSLLQTPLCNNSLKLTNLPEGYFSLFIQATDNEGNSNQFQTNWYVDLTPPTAVVNSHPSSLTNQTTATFTIYCIDQLPCVLHCAVNLTGETPVFTSCNYIFRVIGLSDGQYTFHVKATDAVGNEGAIQTFSWTIDTVPPTLVPPDDIILPCGNNYDPTRTGIPLYSDNIDASPLLNYSDNPVANCKTSRTWFVTDHAGNLAAAIQTIAFVNVIPPVIMGIGDLFIPCGETDKLMSSAYAILALNISSPCGRRININYTDSRSVNQCDMVLTRQWIIADDCNSVVRIAQTIKILPQIDPDFPANDQTDVDLYKALSWPAYPGSLAYNIYIWQYGTTEPTSPTATLPQWQRIYRPSVAYPPNTQILWRIGYVVQYINGPTEIPSPSWGFQTHSFADLTVNSITIPGTAFSGATLTVTWVGANVGNVSTSFSAETFYDAIYLSRTTNFADASLKTVVQQQRYVEPSDLYTSNGIINLSPTDIGKFYVFVVVDIYGFIEDYSRTNNQMLGVQSVQVQLTPPPNLIVTSAGFIGILSSGQQAKLRYTVQNSGIGITAAAAWVDGVFISQFDRKNSSALLLLRITHSGVLASGSQYTSIVDVDIPNAIFGDYYIIISTDTDNNVFENADEGDNDRPVKVSVTLSPYPDLIVQTINCETRVHTGDTLIMNVTVKNIGLGAPFEYAWYDGVSLTDVDTGFTYFSDKNQHFNGQQMLPSTSYVTFFSFIIPPAMKSGYYNVTGYADIYGNVFEFQSEVNNRYNVQIYLVQELPDLTVMFTSVSVVENDFGNYILYNASILNVGTGFVQTNTWENRLFLVSLDGSVHVIESFPMAKNTRQNQIIVITNRLVYLPTTLSGNYSVRLIVDSFYQIIETNKTNNDVQLGSIYVEKRESDLAVTNITAPRSAYSGDLITLWWRVQNVGSIAAGGQVLWRDEVILSVGGSRAALLSAVLISLANPLLPQQMYERQLNVSIPGSFVGIYDLQVSTANYIVFGDGQESNIANNKQATSIAIMVPPSPDFKPVSCRFELSTVSTVRLISTSCDVTNIGNSMMSSKSWTDHLSLLNSANVETLSVEKPNNRKLASRETYTVFFSLIVPPNVIGFFQIRLQVDIYDDVKEFGGENNNVLTLTRPVSIPAAPAAVLSVSFDTLGRTIYVGGSSITVSCTVTNVGPADLPLSTWTDGLYLYPTADASRQQILLSGFLTDSLIQNRKLGIGSSYRLTFQALLPYFANEAIYLYVLPDINNRLPIAQDNIALYFNTSILIQQAPLPDLKVRANNSVVLRVQSGQLYDITFTVYNSANVTAAGMWYDSVYLSRDPVLDPFDTVLKSSQNPSSINGQSNYTQRLSVLIPYDLPSQSFYFIAVANVRKQLLETTFDNNNDYQPLSVEVLPALDLAVNNVRTNKVDVTYQEAVKFDWDIENNGSLKAMGRKCDSVYLSTDDIWDITDVTVVDSKCDSFSFGPKTSSTYESFSTIPPLAVGIYKTIVRTRSNLKDINTRNNFGVSAANLSITPPEISLNSVKILTMQTNQQLVFQLTGVPAGITVAVKLATNYQLAYHVLYVKEGRPPHANDYDYISKQPGTIKQRIIITVTRSYSYYLLVESFSAMSSDNYQLSIAVQEAKFEISSVSPSTMAVGQTATVTVVGTLFGNNMEAFLKNNSFQIAATRLYRFTSEEAFATFDVSRLETGSYTVMLHDKTEDRYCEFTDSVNISKVSLAGQIKTNIITPGGLRAGAKALIQVEIGNNGYSDVNITTILLSTDGHSKLLSTDAEFGTLLSDSILFVPTVRNKPSSVIVPQSSVAFSFTVIPDSPSFVGHEGLHLTLVDDATLLSFVRQLAANLKPDSVAPAVWMTVTDNLNKCLGTKPADHFRSVGGHLSQHYSSFFSIIDLVGHTMEIADGIVPPLILAQSTDISDDIFSGLVELALRREYLHHITARRSTGPFGKGWFSPILELKLRKLGTDISLLKQRREYIFKPKSDDRNVFVNSRLPDDFVVANETSFAYVSDDIIYRFDTATNQLVMFQDAFGLERVVLSYAANKLVSSLTHSNGNAISLTYNADGLVVAAQFTQSGLLTSEVLYAYNSDSLLLRVSDETGFNAYEYTTDGDLKSSENSGPVMVTFEYDDMNLLNSTSTLSNGKLLQQVFTRHWCDGTIDISLYPQNLTYSSVYGLGGMVIQTNPVVGLPVSYHQDTAQSTSDTVLGGDYLLVRQQFDQRSNVYTITDSNGDYVNFEMNNAGQVIRVGDNQGEYYNASYTGPLLTKINYRDGTSESMTYTSLMQLQSISLRDGSSISYMYDINQRVRFRQTTEGKYAYTYAANGLSTSVLSPDGSETKVEFNDKKLPVSVVYSDGTKLEYTYNECYLRKSLTSNNGYNCTYLYDDRCRLTTVMDGEGSTIAQFSYTNDDKLKSKTLANGMRTQYTYDNNSLRLQQLHNFAPNGTLLSSFVYTYDIFGYRIKMVNSEGTWSYRYDSTGRLLRWTSPSSDVWETIDYDSSSNRKSKESSSGKQLYYANSMYQYTSYGNGQNFTYDQNGNTVQKTKRDAGANSQVQFVYNQEGRVTTVSTDQIKCDYKYDAFGAVSLKMCSDGTSVSYLNDPFGTFGSNVLSENSSTNHMFIYYGMQHGLLSSVQMGHIKEALYFLFDGDGSTVHTSDELGAVRNSYSYDPFGVLLNSSVRVDNNAFRYLAQFGLKTVNETNIVWMRNRLYDAEHGYFMSPDPVGGLSSPTNPYLYANNNPLTYKDPDGLLAHAVAIIGAGAILGGFYGGISAAIKYRNEDIDTYKGQIAGGIVGGIVSGAFFSGGVITGNGLVSFAGGVAGSLVSTKTCRFFAECRSSVNDVLWSGVYNVFPRNLFFLKGRIPDLPIKYLLNPLNKAGLSMHSSFGWSAFLSFCDPRMTFSCAAINFDPAKWFLDWLRSQDPNDIFGPPGYGDGHFIAPSQVLDYKIEFENDPNATAPAQYVQIDCILDPGLDIATLKVGSFAFGDFSIDAGFTSTRYYKLVDTRQITGTYLFLQATPNVAEYKITFVFQALDETGQQPSNVSIGFLPPNNGTSGQGYVTFRISLKDSIENLARIYENATIVFDQNSPIVTKTIFNTVDKFPPENVTISWTQLSGGGLLQFSTEDIGSGVKSFDLYDINKSNKPPLQVKTGINSSNVIIIFKQLPGSDFSNMANQKDNVIYLDSNEDYQFTVVAVDNVDNRQPIDFTNTVEVSYASNLTCPSQCSGQGTCTLDGCLCTDGFFGVSCNQTISQLCEPPILELSYDNQTTADVSVVLHISASAPPTAGAASLFAEVTVHPTAAIFGKGKRQPDGSWHLNSTDFGDVTLTPPSTFIGYMNLTASAVLVSACGNQLRTQDGSIYVKPASIYTNTTDQPSDGPNTGNLATASTMPPMFSTHTAATDSAQPVSSTISGSGRGTTAVNKASTGSPIQQSTVAYFWGPWSEWTNCSRSCDSGIRTRSRQCTSVNSACVGDNTNVETCLITACPGLSYTNYVIVWNTSC